MGRRQVGSVRMKFQSFIYSLLFSLLGSCEDKPKMSPPAPNTIDRKIPAGPARAAAAAVNTRPVLENDLSALGLHFGDPVFFRAFKEEAKLEVFVLDRASQKFVLFRTYPIAAASGELGPKLAEGDGQVPEGFYFVPPAAMNPASQFHLSFNIGYPNEYDRSYQRTGSAIMVHGNCVSIGCLAMTDPKIEEIYTLGAAAHAGGQAFFRFHIFPFRMTTERTAAAADTVNAEFWSNLKQGYDHFEQNRLPPEVTVVAGRYLFK
jgi:murein L,D-transpeptidase YafK